MRVITSQNYINWDIVSRKMEALKDIGSVELTVWTTGLQNEDGDDLVILADGHHTYQAAKELGIEVKFVEDPHPEGVTGEALLDLAWMDSDWRYLDNNNLVW